MGNGIVRRYKPGDKDDVNINNWRKPKENRRPKGSNADPSGSKIGKAAKPAGGASVDSEHISYRQTTISVAAQSALSNPPPGSSSGSTASKPSTLGSAWTGEKSSTTWSRASSDKPAFSLLDGPNDEEDDLAGCSNLADAAAKAWENLMSRQDDLSNKDFGSLFTLGDIKDCIERTAKRLEVFVREAAIASAKLEEKREAIESVCSKFEERALGNAGSTAQWKLGDLAIRRGKGPCELSMVHHEAEPPYFEVRMHIGGNVVGTEARNLLPLAPPQQSVLRGSFREYEQARLAKEAADEAVSQAQDELKQQHSNLTEQVEKVLQVNCQTQQPVPSSSAPGSTSAPLGFPSFDELKLMEKQQEVTPRGKSSAPHGFPPVNELKHSERQQEVTVKSAPPARSTSACEPLPASRTSSKVPPGEGSSHQRPGKPDQQHEQAQRCAESKLQTDWVVYQTMDGQFYYHNERTQQTAWSLPQGATCRQPGSQSADQASAQTSAGGEEQDAPQQNDPFADLRRKEEEMHAQREQWTQWYSQYCQWYSAQAAANGASAGVPGNAPPNMTGQRYEASRSGYSEQPSESAGAGGRHPGSAGQPGAQPSSSSTRSAPPKGPAPPVLNAGFEDHAVFAIKSSVLKEMEAMVAQAASLAQRKKALRCLQMTWHPDKNPERLEVAKNVFQFIEETKPWFLHDAAGA